MGLISFALLPRLYIALSFGVTPVWDGYYYDIGAKRIAGGFGYSDELIEGGYPVWHPWSHYPVGYSVFLAFFYRFIGTFPWMGPVVNACVGAACPLFTWLLGRHALSEKRARFAALLVALHPGLILYSATFMTELLTTLLILLSFWLLVRARHSLWSFVGASLIIGIASFVRPQTFLCTPFLALAVPGGWSRMRWWRPFGYGLLGAVLALIPTLPWTLRNCHVLDQCTWISTNGGWNLAIGAFHRATGRFEALHASDGCSTTLGPVQQDRCWLHYGLAHIQAEPLRWLALIPRKLHYTFDYETFAVEYLAQANPERWTERDRKLGWYALTWFHDALVCMAVVAMIRLGWSAAKPLQAGIWIGVGALSVTVATWLQKEVAVWPLVVLISLLPWLRTSSTSSWPLPFQLSFVWIALTAMTHIIFFGEDRYHIVITPMLCIFAACYVFRSDKKPLSWLT
ncbi:hypothetical protein BCY86_00535 [Pajaroellobacter abortibovis]|uniref:Glycosyltransferase RgtA/B/C/D-like domain-containing protein n=1 Tax=Pajaroellobacter abortibovis TaxID=1882918 RepID=A0A1L6MUY7_9BACT|nr:hypothetical protein BCY86_00535 [Pajaroellobacter abortibovis]